VARPFTLLVLSKLTQLAVPLLVLMAVAPTSQGATIVVPLPDLIGTRDQVSEAQPVSVDLGVPFTTINEVRLQLTGTAKPTIMKDRYGVTCLLILRN